MKTEIVVLSGATQFNISSTIRSETGKFKNGEICFRLKDSVRHNGVILIQSFENTNDNLMELLIAIDACVRSGAAYVTAILPIFPYSRQDKRHKSGTPISAKLVCDMISSAGVDRVITFDLHADQIQGFMDSSVVFDHIELASFLSYNLRKIFTNIYDWTFVSPDAGAVKRTKKLADMCGAKDLVIMDKTRTRSNIVDEIRLIGDVNNRDVVIVDDIIDTGGTLVKATDELAIRGCNNQILVCTHPVFSPPAYLNLDGMKVFCTNSLPIKFVDDDGIKLITDMEVFDLTPFIKDVIVSIINGRNMGHLFKNWKPNVGIYGK